MCYRGVLVLVVICACACSKNAVPQAGDACTTISECVLTQGLACMGGACIEIACARTLDCPMDAACVDGLCGGAECLDSSECAGGTCFEGDCRTDLCTSREECDGGEVCRGNPPLCQAPLESCEDEQGCPVGQTCKPETAACVQACSLISECDEGSWCDEGVCRATCESQGVCDTQERCIQGLCRAPLDCSMSAPCPREALLRDVYSCQCVSCFNEQDCQIAQGEVCIDGACVACESAPQQGLTCAAQSLRNASEFCCVECLSDADCEVGSLCERGACLDTRNRACTQDSECPAPLFCDGRLCVSSASLTACVLQSDCSPGEACFGDGRCHVQADTCAAGCRSPSRCIDAIERTGGAGSCVGCQEACGTSQCPTDMKCYLPEEAREGWCVGQSFWRQICAE